MGDFFCMKKENMEQMLAAMDQQLAVFSFGENGDYISDKLSDFLDSISLDPDNSADKVTFINYLMENSLETAKTSGNCAHHSGIIDNDEKYLIFHLFVSEQSYFGFFVDKTEQIYGKLKLRKEISETQKKSRTDALTNVLNRSGFESTVRSYMEKNAGKGILCIMDMDNFKLVNDMLGHPTGDKVLKQFAALLNERFSERAYVGRIGGDEFVVYFYNTMTRDALSAELSGFISAVKETFGPEYPNQRLSSSIGAAYADEVEGGYPALYKKADSALYMVKESGKGTFRIADA